MKIEPAKIPSELQGVSFKVPQYESKEVANINGKSIMAENYIDEVNNILDPDGDGFDENGRKVKTVAMESAASPIYIQHNEDGYEIARYMDYDSNDLIDRAIYFEYSEDGSKEGIYTDSDNDGTIDSANYLIYEDEHIVESYTDLSNDGGIDQAVYFEYEENTDHKVATYTDEDNDGKIDHVSRYN